MRRPMEVVKINAIEVAPGRGAELEERFARRAAEVEAMPGFRGFELLRPTAGETRELSIAENCRSANSRRARVFCFGVGYDVNARLLDRLSGGNSGTSEYVKPDEDIESHVAAFYSKMTRPALSDIRVELTGVDVNRTYPRDLPDLFEGGQIVWAGRYRQSGRTTIRVTGKVAGDRRTLEFPAELAGSSSGSTYDFVERLWAVRRLGVLRR